MATNNQARPSEVTCQLCFEFYLEPLMLPCLHSFCKKCVKQQIEEQGSSAGTLKCPTCADTCSVPSNGFPSNLWLGHQAEIAGYQQKFEGNAPCDRCTKASASAAVFCCSCCMFMCSSCRDDHQHWKELASHELVDLGKEKKQKTTLLKVQPQDSKCPEHSDEKLKFYCEDCEVLTCRDCLTEYHQLHKYKHQNKVGKSGKEELQQSLATCAKAITSLDRAIDSGEKMLQRIKGRKLQVDEEFGEAFDSLQDQIEQRRNELLEKSQQLETGKMSVVNIKLENFQKVKDSLTFASQFVDSALVTHSTGELLSIKKTMKEKLVSLIQKFSEVSLVIDDNDHMITSRDLTTISSQLAKFGSVVDVDPFKSYIAEGIAVPLAVVGKERKFKIVLMDENGEKLNSNISIRATLKFKGEESPKEIDLPVTLEEDGGVQVGVTPQSVGECELSVIIAGQHVQHSPFTMWSRNPPNYPNASCQQYFGVSSSSYGVAVHPNGDVYVTSDSHCIHVFDSNETAKPTIGSQGSGDGEIKYPRGLVFVGEVLYVVDQGNNRVQKFTTTGEYLGQFGSSGSGDGQLNSPWGICADAKGHVLVADYSNQRIVAFSTDGTFAFNISCKVNSYDVAVDNTGAIHIADFNSHRILVYSSDGQQQLRAYTDTSGSFQYPMGLTIDEEGNAIISCRYSSAYYVRVLNSSNGARLASYGSGSSLIYSVALDKNGHIYSAEYNNKRVAKYVS